MYYVLCNITLDFSPRAPWNPSPEPERRQWPFFRLLWVRRARPCFGNRSLRNSLDRMSSLQQKSKILLKFAFHHLSNLRVTFKRLTWILWSRLGTVAKWTVSYVAGRSAGTPSGAPLTQPRSKPINRKKGSLYIFSILCTRQEGVWNNKNWKVLIGDFYLPTTHWLPMISSPHLGEYFIVHSIELSRQGS